MTQDLEIVSEAEQTWPLNHCLLFSLLMRVELMYHACSNFPCSRYTNEIHAQAKNGRAKRATLLVRTKHAHVVCTRNVIPAAQTFVRIHCVHMHV